MLATVILSTYNQPRPLELAIHAYAAQTCRDFELIVADDGSDAATAAACQHAAQQTGLAVRRVWHEDLGVRTGRILNEALLDAQGECVIISEGGCLPRRDFVATHLRLARRGRFLSGGRVGLPPGADNLLTPRDVRAGRFADPLWLGVRGIRPTVSPDRLCRGPRVAALADRLTPTRPTWNLHNASAWRDDLLRVNGFDERMGRGGLDRELGERLINAGVQPIQIRHRAVCVRLEHSLEDVDKSVLETNRAIRNAVQRERLAWTDHGVYRRMLVPTAGVSSESRTQPFSVITEEGPITLSDVA